MKKPCPWACVQGVHYPDRTPLSEAEKAARRRRWQEVQGVAYPLTMNELKARGWVDIAEAAAILGLSVKTARRFLRRHRVMYRTAPTPRRPALMWLRAEVEAAKAHVMSKEVVETPIFASLNRASSITGFATWRIRKAAKQGRIRTMQGRDYHNVPCRLYYLEDIVAVCSTLPF